MYACTGRSTAAEIPNPKMRETYPKSLVISTYILLYFYLQKKKSSHIYIPRINQQRCTSRSK